MNPKQFLQIGGAVLAVVGVLGMVGVLGPTAEQSIFGEAWWFDNAENWAHLVLGIVALAAAFAIGASMQKTLVLLVGIVGVLVGLYGFVSPTLLGANLQNPADNILHIAVGLWALWAWKGGKM
ncbi:MAG: hypothetical protein HYS52_01180 [Candidatus Wildermuthbacteria bacterium]|nr:hypothetical protein [Candidatus Wildermuthbacteria bacterium]